uniref:PAS domain-containing protein n=1 Tax=Thiocapsa sp. TaxID=2024551 RepID=UPI003428B170
MVANHTDLWNADLPDALMLLDGTGRVCRWGAGAQQMFGYKAADAVGMPLDALIAIPDG